MKILLSLALLLPAVCAAGAVTALDTVRVGLSLRITNLAGADYADRADYAFGDDRYFPGRGRAAFLEIGWKRD